MKDRCTERRYDYEKKERNKERPIYDKKEKIKKERQEFEKKDRHDFKKKGR